VIAGNTPVLVHNCPSRGAAEATVRMRHYTNSRGAAGILDSGVIRASDQNKVFMVPTRGKPMRPRDAENELGVGKGRGRKVIEFDSPAGRVSKGSNPTMGITEWVADGDLKISNARAVRFVGGGTLSRLHGDLPALSAFGDVRWHLSVLPSPLPSTRSSAEGRHGAGR